MRQLECGHVNIVKYTPVCIPHSPSELFGVGLICLHRIRNFMMYWANLH